jgi:hypothetical protein
MSRPTDVCAKRHSRRKLRIGGSFEALDESVTNVLEHNALAEPMLPSRAWVRELQIAAVDPAVFAFHFGMIPPD